MASTRAGDPCPSRARPQAAGPPSGRTTSRGPDRAPRLFCCPPPTIEPAGNDPSREAPDVMNVESDPRRCSLERPHRHPATLTTPPGATIVTAILNPELKSGSPGPGPLPVLDRLATRTS